jgi:hypothetical protein
MAVDVKQHTTKLSGKDYVMVSGRVLMAHEDNKEVLSILTDKTAETDEYIEVKATVITRKGTFTGQARSNLKTGSPQEKKTPLEVAETSAVGRALGFAGYAIEGGIASADEMLKAGFTADAAPRTAQAQSPNMAELARTTPPRPTKKPAPVQDAPAEPCGKCGNVIEGVDTGAGKTSAAQIAASTLKVFGQSLCMTCARTAQAEKLAKA